MAEFDSRQIHRKENRKGKEKQKAGAYGQAGANKNKNFAPVFLAEQFRPSNGIFKSNFQHRMDRACSWLSNSYLVFKIHEHGEKIHTFPETPVLIAAAEEQGRNNENEG